MGGIRIRIAVPYSATWRRSVEHLGVYTHPVSQLLRVPGLRSLHLVPCTCQAILSPFCGDDICHKRNTLYPKPLLTFKPHPEISLMSIRNARNAAILPGTLLCCILVLFYFSTPVRPTLCWEDAVLNSLLWCFKFHSLFSSV